MDSTSCTVTVVQISKSFCQRSCSKKRKGARQKKARGSLVNKSIMLKICNGSDSHYIHKEKKQVKLSCETGTKQWQENNVTMRWSLVTYILFIAFICSWTDCYSIQEECLKAPLTWPEFIWKMHRGMQICFQCALKLQSEQNIQECRSWINSCKAL